MPLKSDSEFVRGLKAALRIARVWAPYYSAGQIASTITSVIARERRKKGARK